MSNGYGLSQQKEQSSLVGGGSSPVSRERIIPMLTGRLAGAVGELEAQLQELFSRLEPALRPVAETSAKPPSSQPSEPMPPLGHELSDKADRVNEMSRYVRQCINRLEI